MKLRLRNGKVLRSSTTGAMLVVEEERPPLQEQIDQLEEQLENASIYPGNTGNAGRDGVDGQSIWVSRAITTSETLTPPTSSFPSISSLGGTPKVNDYYIENYSQSNNASAPKYLAIYKVTSVTDTLALGTLVNYIKASGEKGADGKDGEDGRGIVSITKTSINGLNDTYTITYTDNTTSTFTVTNGADGNSTEYHQLRVDYEAVQTVHYDDDTIYWDTVLKMEDEDSEEVDRKPINIQLPIIAGNGIEFTPNQDGSRMTINATGGGSSFTMPIIRLGNVSDIDGTMVITESNPLKFRVEVIGGELQVGDELQLCSRRLYTYMNDTGDGRIKRYKLRQFVKYIITEEDLTKRYILISVAYNGEIKELLRGGGKPNSTVNNYYTKYLRIRRTHPDNPYNALFSNAVPFQVFGRYDKENDGSLGVVTIR